MSRHILDHPPTRTATSLIKTYNKAGTTGPHPTTLALQRRHSDRLKQNRRLQEFLRIDSLKR